MQPLEERMEELGGGEFLEVFANNDTDGDDDDGGGSDDDVDDNEGAWGRKVPRGRGLVVMLMENTDLPV